jgi:hypothetical protein
MPGECRVRRQVQYDEYLVDGEANNGNTLDCAEPSYGQQALPITIWTIPFSPAQVAPYLWHGLLSEWGQCGRSRNLLHRL